MKKFLFILSAGFAIMLTSCGSKKESGGMSDAAKKNLEGMSAVVSAFQTGDLSKIDDHVDASFIDHTDRGDMGRDSLKAMITMMHSADSTMKFTLVKQLADDEYAMGWYTITGTGNGQMGMPSGPYTMNSVDVVKFKDGKAIEHWSFAEYREMMKMMGDMMKGMSAPGPEVKPE